MKKRHVTDGIRKLNLPQDVFHQMELFLWEEAETTHGAGKFLYVPFTILIPPSSAPILAGDSPPPVGVGSANVEVVGVLFEKGVKQRNIDAKRGDTSFHLRSEWNEKENPL